MTQMIDIVVPDSDKEGTESLLEGWLKEIGDFVNEHEPILEINTDKVTIEVAAPASGFLREILKEPNEPVEPGECLGRIEIAVGQSAVETKAPPRSPRKSRELQADAQKAAVRLSPAVKKLLQTHQLEASLIGGTGRGGRLTVEDVERYLAEQRITDGGDDVSEIPSRRVPHSPVRLRVAKHMVESMLKTAPHVTDVFEMDLSGMIANRECQKNAFLEKGVKLTYTAYFVDAAAKALQAVPEVNSRWHENELEVFEDYNIGIATATDNGLVVPVIPQAQHLDLFGIAERLQTVIGRARDGKLATQDIRNGTFTITNHGITGSLIATPIIHQPQSAILGIGKIEKRIVVVEKDGKDTTEIKPMAYVTLTIDHRVLDGFMANLFLTKFVETLQDW